MKQLLIVGLGFLLLYGCQAATAPLALQDETDRINYSIGYQIGGDFRDQQIALRPEAIVAGIDAAVKGSPPLIDQAQMHQTLVALKKRIVAEDQKALQQGATPAQGEAHKAAGEAKVFYQKNSSRPEVREFMPGVQYEVLATGDGASPVADDQVELHIVSQLSNGRLLADSRKTGKPLVYPISKLVPGVRDLVLQMHEGDRWKMYVLPGVAYRGRSALDDHAVIMDVELLKVLPQQKKAQ